jgi:type I restriction enzyme M protein
LPPLRDRRGDVLFIDARKLGTLVDRTRKEFSDDDVAKIAGVYHAWRARKTGRPRGAPLKSSSGPSYKGERSES